VQLSGAALGNPARHRVLDVTRGGLEQAQQERKTNLARQGISATRISILPLLAPDDLVVVPAGAAP
jgi:hypothetical protein